mgnify:CR=1 FL=1
MVEQKPQAPGLPAASRRIIVGLDTSFMAREALALAARVAASVDADLNGIFVEDENLLALSALPFAREISMAGAVSQMCEADMLRAMQAQAQIARRVLERAAKDAHIGWHFDIARGHRLAALTHHAGADDTLVIRAHEASRLDVGRTIRAATRDIRADVLLAARGVAVAATFAAPDLRAAQMALPERPFWLMKAQALARLASVSQKRSQHALVRHFAAFLRVDLPPPTSPLRPARPMLG